MKMKLRQARKITKRFKEFLHEREQNLKEFNTLSHKFNRAVIVVNHFSPCGRKTNLFIQGYLARSRREKKACKTKNNLI